MIPVKYNIRNLRVRWVTTLMTVVGTGLVVWATVLSFGLSDGLELALREKLDINKVNFEIVGYFEAGGSAAESEVWTDLRDLTSARRTPAALSAVNLRARDSAAKTALLARIKDDKQFKLDAVDEAE